MTATMPLIAKLEKKRAHQVYKLADGTKVPGGSTIAKIGADPSALIHWAWQCGMDGLDHRKVREAAADVGTACHFMIECHLAGKKPDLSEFSPADIDLAETAFLKFLDFLNTEKLTVLETEVQLVSEKHRYGGTLDFVALDGSDRLCLIDWKTSKAIFPEYLRQLGGYEQLWNEAKGDPIQRRCIVRIGKKEKGDFETRWLSDMHVYMNTFNAQLGLYYALRAEKL